MVKNKGVNVVEAKKQKNEKKVVVRLEREIVKMWVYIFYCHLLYFQQHGGDNLKKRIKF